MEEQNNANSKVIEEYIKVISLKKKNFLNRVIKEDDCNAELSDDAEILQNSINASLIQLNNNTKTVNKLSDV